MRQQLAGVRNERLQQAVLGRRQVDRVPIPGHEALRNVDLEPAEPHHRRHRLLRLCTPQCGAGPCEQFLHPERLGDEIIRAGVERGDLVLLGVPHGEHDHRDLAEGSDPADHLGAVEVGQAQIQQHQVGGPLGRRHNALLAGANRGHVVSVGLKAGAQGTTDLGFVVDDQHHAHAAVSGSAWIASSGTSNTTAVPPTGASSIHTLPPWASTIACTIARPEPAPGSLGTHLPPVEGLEDLLPLLRWDARHPGRSREPGRRRRTPTPLPRSRIPSARSGRRSPTGS